MPMRRRDVGRHARASPPREAAERARTRSAPASRTPAPPPVRRIIRENVFTLVNAIALGFLILIALAGAWNDAIFAAVIASTRRSASGRSCWRKRKLDRLALLVAPRARVRRDGANGDVPAEESCPTTSSSCSPATRSWPTAWWPRRPASRWTSRS